MVHVVSGSLSLQLLVAGRTTSLQHSICIPSSSNPAVHSLWFFVQLLNTSCQNQSGRNLPGPDRTGPDQPGPDRTGPDRPGLDWPGPARTGPARPRYRSKPFLFTVSPKITADNLYMLKRDSITFFCAVCNVKIR